MSGSPPSVNPADTGDMAGVLRGVLGKFINGIDDMLPAKVISYDRDTNRAKVQPMIALLTTDSKNVSRNFISSVPVFNLGGGSVVMLFDLKPGDLGWIKATDRDIADFLKTYKESTPSTLRVHSFDTGIFFPDVMTGYDINEDDEGAAVIQTLDGAVRISLFPNKLKVTAPLVEVDTPSLTTTGDFSNGGDASLGGGGSAIARLGDAVQVTIVGGSSAGVHSGTITAGSTKHKAT